MNRENQYPQTPLEDQSGRHYGDKSKVAIIQAGDILVAQINKDKAERQSHLHEKSNDCTNK